MRPYAAAYEIEEYQPSRLSAFSSCLLHFTETAPAREAQRDLVCIFLPSVYFENDFYIDASSSKILPFPVKCRVHFMQHTWSATSSFSMSVLSKLTLVIIASFSESSSFIASI